MQVFREKKKDKELKRDGFVKFKLGESSLIDSCTAALTKLIPDYDKNIGESFYGSVAIAELQLKKEFHQAMHNLLAGPLNQILINHKALCYFYLVKTNSEKSALNVHQDWSIVDERKFSGYNLWIPLGDSTIENGTLHAIKGSHKFPLNVRGPGIKSKYLPHAKAAKDFLDPIIVKKGEALIFDSRIIHYSPPNSSDTPRTAVINNIVPENAKIRFYHGREEEGHSIVSEYAAPEDFFMQYDDFVNQKEMPNPLGKLIGEIDYANADVISEEEFLDLVKQYAPKKKWFNFFS